MYGVCVHHGIVVLKVCIRLCIYIRRRSVHTCTKSKKRVPTAFYFFLDGTHALLCLVYRPDIWVHRSSSMCKSMYVQTMDTRLGCPSIPRERGTGRVDATRGCRHTLARAHARTHAHIHFFFLDDIIMSSVSVTGTRASSSRLERDAINLNRAWVGNSIRMEWIVINSDSATHDARRARTRRGDE